MSERASFRGGRGGGRGGNYNNRGGGRGQHHGGGGHHNNSNQSGEKPKKENILDLTKYMDKEVIVKFSGGREGVFFIITLSAGDCLTNGMIVSGLLKGYDQLMNLVLDEAKEMMRGMCHF